MQHNEGHTTDLDVDFLEPSRFPNGWVYFTAALPSKTGESISMVHNNWVDDSQADQVDGSATSCVPSFRRSRVHLNVQRKCFHHPSLCAFATARALGPLPLQVKQFRFREALMWERDSAMHFDGTLPISNTFARPPSAGRFLVYTHSSESPNLDSELRALYDGLAVAAFLGRTLILPRWFCAHGCGEFTIDSVSRPPTHPPATHASAPPTPLGDRHPGVPTSLRSARVILPLEPPSPASSSLCRTAARWPHTCARAQLDGYACLGAASGGVRRRHGASHPCGGGVRDGERCPAEGRA